MRVAVLGGSFDPPHIGHYFVAKQIAEIRADIDKIFLMPAYKHQWKPIQASAKDRLSMLECLVDEKINISDLEIQQKSGKYTIDTIRALKKDRKTEIYWIVGSDILSEWERWVKKEELLKLAKFLVFPRDGFKVPESLPVGFEVVADTNLIITNISSTIIRQRVKAKKTIRHMVPKMIEMYIEKNRLYQ